MSNNNLRFIKRAQRVRSTIRSNKHPKPRLSVFRSGRHIHAQLINDITGTTIVSASTVEKDLQSKLKNTHDMQAAEFIGETIAKRAIDANVSTIVFDRGGYQYHGRVKALAEAARKAGLKF